MAAALWAGRTPQSRRSDVPDAPRERTPVLGAGDVAVHTFPSPFSRIEAVHLLIGCDTPSPGAAYRVRVWMDGRLIAETEIEGPFAAASWTDIPVDGAAADGTRVRVEIEGLDVPDGQGVFLFYSPYPDAGEPSALNGELLEGRLIQAATGIVASREKVFLWAAVVLGGLGALLLLGSRVERNFAVIAVVLGLLILVVHPVGAGFDEHRHFARAWQLSGGGMAPAVSGEGAVIEVPRALTPLTTVNSFRLARALDELWLWPDAGDTVLSREYAVESTAFYAYLPAALGVALGRLTGLPLVFIYYLGRMTGLAAYVLLGYAALRITPCFKRLFFTIGLLPQALVLAAGYSTDPVVTGLAMLLAACWFSWTRDGGLSARRAVLLSGLLALIALVKAPYALLALLLACTPRSAYRDSAARRAGWAAAAAAGIAAAGWALLVRAVWGGVPNSTALDGAANTLEQLRYLAAHPAAGPAVLIRSLAGLSADWIAGLSVYANGQYSAGVWQAFTPVALAAVAVTDGPAPERPLRRALLLTAAVSVCGLILALYLAWSEPGAPLPWGIQGRYFIPLLFVLLPPLGGWALPRIRDAELRLGWVMTLMGCCTLAAMIQYYY